MAAFFQEPTINYFLVAGPQAAQSRGMIEFALSTKEQGFCRSLLESMRMRSEERSPFADQEQIAYLVLFLSQLARAAGDAVTDSISAHPAKPIHPAARQMMNLIESRIADAWSIQDLAKEVCLEGTYCTRLFKTATGLSPIAYLSRCRAERAASLLLRTGLPVAEIAIQVGWRDQNYFARRFRSHFGISATEYRARFAPEG
jgi:AraC family L-rhamnose operon transcriptional activator RhaR